MKLSIIIVSWNTQDLLARCLASVAASPPAGDYEVLVIDNASRDGSAEMVRACFPNVRLIQNDANVGFAAANNQAMRMTTAEQVLLLNSDTEVQPDALARLVAFLEQHPQAGAVGPWLLNPDGSLQESCYPAPTLGRELWRLLHLDALYPYGRYHMRQWPSDRPRAVDVLLGACLLLRREVLDQVGLFDESYFMYSEEVDLCHRIRQAGWRIYWTPTARVLHYGGQSTRQAAAAMFLQLYRSKIQYFRKFYGRRAANVYKLIIALTSLPRVAAAALVWLAPAATRNQATRTAASYRQLLAHLSEM